MIKTLGNKIMAVTMMTIGILSTKIDGDGGALVIMLMIGIPLFFEKENWI